MRHQVRRAYNLPFNDPRLAEWSPSDWLREAAWLSIEWEDPQTPEDVEREEAFDEEIDLASAGDWEALGLDPPALATSDASPGSSDGSLATVPVSVEEFMRGEEP